VDPAGPRSSSPWSQAEPRRRRAMFMRRISITACLFIAACGGLVACSGPTAYEEMNFEERRAFMTDVVLPPMTETLVAFDPKFKGMGCTTCHGSGAENGSFAMPNPELPVLPASEAAFYEYLKDPEHARWGQFMMDKVWPQMADLLEVAKYDPKTKADGFSC